MSDPEDRAIARVATVDWTVLFAIASLVSLTVWIPVPLLDLAVESWLRRRMVLAAGRRRGVDLDPEAIKALANTPGGGCRGCLVLAVVWPIKKLFKSVLFVFNVKDMADLSADAIHRGLMLEEAFDRGWLPEQPEKVRAAMDAAVAQIHVRPLERLMWGPFARQDPHWQGAIAKAAGRERERALAGGEPTSVAARAATRFPGVLPEVLHAFRAEMGLAPEIEQRVAGLIEPEVVPPDETALDGRPEPPAVEDAQEIPPRPKG